MTATTAVYDANAAAVKSFTERGEATEIATTAGAQVFRMVSWQDKVHYGMRVASPRSPGNGKSVGFSWVEDPEFRVSADGHPAAPKVTVGQDTALADAPKYVQTAVAEVLERIAAFEQDRHRVNPRTPAQHELIGPYLTREQYGQAEHLAELKLDHLDRATVLAVLRAALEYDWATPEEKADLEEARDEALGELEEVKPQLKDLEELRAAGDEVHEEATRFLSRFEPTGLHPEGLETAQCAVVVDEARFFDESLAKLASRLQ